MIYSNARLVRDASHTSESGVQGYWVRYYHNGRTTQWCAGWQPADRAVEGPVENCPMH